VVAVPNAADVFAVDVVGEDVGLGLEAELAEEVELAVGVGVEVLEVVELAVGVGVGLDADVVELAVGEVVEVVEVAEGVGAGLDLVEASSAFESSFDSSLSSSSGILNGSLLFKSSSSSFFFKTPVLLSLPCSTKSGFLVTFPFTCSFKP